MTHRLIECLTSDAPLLDLLQDLTWPARPAAATDTAMRAPVRWVAHLRNEPVLIPRSKWSAADERADIIVADHAPNGALVLHLGVRTHWTVLWHREFRLFMPQVGRALIVPGGFRTDMHFAIDEDGCLDAHEGVPYRTYAEYEAGCARADALVTARLRRSGGDMAIAC